LLILKTKIITIKLIILILILLTIDANTITFIAIIVIYMVYIVLGFIIGYLLYKSNMPFLTEMYQDVYLTIFELNNKIFSSLQSIIPEQYLELFGFLILLANLILPGVLVLVIINFIKNNTFSKITYLFLFSFIIIFFIYFSPIKALFFSIIVSIFFLLITKIGSPIANLFLSISISLFSLFYINSIINDSKIVEIYINSFKNYLPFLENQLIKYIIYIFIFLPFILLTLFYFDSKGESNDDK